MIFSRFVINRSLFILIASVLTFGCANLTKKTTATESEKTDVTLLPNPYDSKSNWAQMPDGRNLGNTSAIGVDSKGHIWIGERCGGDDCSGKDIAPVVEFAPSGNATSSFGKGDFSFPHGMTIDRDDNIWLTDKLENRVYKFSSEGKILLILKDTFSPGKSISEPNNVAIAPNGDIFVSAGHSNRAIHQILKYSKEGVFIKAWGSLGSHAGEFNVPHALAFDSHGRLLVADRDNCRIQLFNQTGNYLGEWKQFGCISGLFIDKNDVLYAVPYANSRSSPRERGIAIGNASDGSLQAFIPDSTPRSVGSMEGIAVDSSGSIYTSACVIGTKYGGSASTKENPKGLSIWKHTRRLPAPQLP